LRRGPIKIIGVNRDKKGENLEAFLDEIGRIHERGEMKRLDYRELVKL
jgi:hypothetical protein